MTPANSIRVLLVEDHPLTSRGLRDTLEDEEGFEVAGQAADGMEAVRLAQETRPDVIVMDLFHPRNGRRGRLPGDPGAAARNPGPGPHRLRRRERRDSGGIGRGHGLPPEGDGQR